MALNMQQQITIAARAITYANDREATRRARCEFNVALQPSTVGKWRKRLLETGRMQKIKTPERPRICTDAETTERIVEAFDARPQKSTRQAAGELDISQSSVCRILKLEKYQPFKPIRVHEEEATLHGQPVPLTSQRVTIGCGVIEGESLYPETSRRRHAEISD